LRGPACFQRIRRDRSSIRRGLLSERQNTNRYGDFKEALECYNESLESNPNSLETWFLRAGVLAELGRYQEAVSSYDKAIEIDPVQNFLLAAQRRRSQ